MKHLLQTWGSKTGKNLQSIGKTLVAFVIGTPKNWPIELSWLRLLVCVFAINRRTWDRIFTSLNSVNELKNDAGKGFKLALWLDWLAAQKISLKSRSLKFDSLKDISPFTLHLNKEQNFCRIIRTSFYDHDDFKTLILSFNAKRCSTFGNINKVNLYFGQW